MSSGLIRGSNDSSATPASPWATHRLPRGGYPAFNRYYGDAKTASARLLHLRLTLGARYPGCFLLLGDCERKARPRSWILLSRCDPIRHCPRRQEALPASLETPSPLCPALRPRADLYARPVAAFRHGPLNSYNEGSPINKHFGARSHGFTTRCLRLKTPFPNANQGSLPVDGQSFPGGIVPRRVSPEAFSCSLRHRLLSVRGFGLRAPSPPLRASAGAREIAFPGWLDG
jgi:hypothetical protein